MSSGLFRAAASFPELKANRRQIFNPALKRTGRGTISRTVSTPRVCPATRGRKRFGPATVAIHDDAPRGAALVPLAGTICVELDKTCHCARRLPVKPPSTRSLSEEHLVDFGDKFVGQLLDVVLGRRSSSSEDGLRLQAILERAIGIAAQVAHGDLGVFAFVLDDLGQSLRRSSVSAGIGTRISSPCVGG